MCQIFGWAGNPRRGTWRLIHHVLGELYCESSSRNPDATGFAAFTKADFQAERKRLTYEKWPRPASTFTVGCEAWCSLRPSPLVVCHTRLATHGDPQAENGQRNNHPFVSADRSLAIIHNGIIRNHADLTRRYGLACESDCDSEVLLRLLEMHPDSVRGLSLALRQIEGSMATAVIDAYEGAIYVARDDYRPLWLFSLKRVSGWFFASTEPLVAGALQVVLGDQWGQHVECLIPLHPYLVFRLAADGSAHTFELA